MGVLKQRAFGFAVLRLFLCFYLRLTNLSGLRARTEKLELYIGEVLGDGNCASWSVRALSSQNPELSAEATPEALVEQQMLREDPCVALIYSCVSLVVYVCVFRLSRPTRLTISNGYRMLVT